MNRRRSPYRSLLCLLATTALFTAAATAELQMGAQLSPATIATGDATVFVVQIAGIEGSKRPTLDVEEGDAAGIQSKFVGVASQMFRNGRTIQKMTTYRFSITGVKPGVYSIAGALEHEGELFGTQAQTLTVRPPTEAEKSLTPEFDIEVEKREIYLGELLPIKLVISTNPNTSPEFRNVAPEVESNGFVMQPLRGIYRAGADSDGNDRHFFEGSCEALRAGDLTLGPATYPMKIAIRNRSIGRSSRKQYELSSDPITITVNPLPVEGKPESFNGTVGRFQMDIAASPLKLRQGEPISVNLTIAGEGNLPSIDAPILTGDTDAWKQYDPSRVDSRDQNRNSRNMRTPASNAGRVTFTHMIVPLQTETQIPPFEFSFFDPEIGSYQTLRTDAIPIEVSADPNALVARSSPPSPATGDPDPTVAEVPPSLPPPLAEMTDILSIRDLGDQQWQDARGPVTQSRLFWALQAPPAAALLGLIFFACGRGIERRKTDSNWTGTYPPCSETLLKLESEPVDSHQFYDLAHQFLAAWEDQSPGDRISGLDPETTKSIAVIRERHGFFAFGGSADQAAAPLDRDEQAEVIRTLKTLPIPDHA